MAILLMPALCNAQATNNIKKNTKIKEVKMSANESNKEIIQKVYEQALNKRKMYLLNDMISAEYVCIKGAKGAPTFQEPIVLLIKAFPDIQWHIEQLVAENDKVAVKWKWQGTHSGQFQQYIPTGKATSNEGSAIFKFKDGKIISSDVITDRLGFLQQVEALPSDLTLLSNKKTSKENIRFIDKFIVPEKAKTEFMERVNINRKFIKQLPGFIKDEAYERKDENGNIVFITIAVWENQGSVEKAKEAVQAEYKKQGFDPAAMFNRLNIVLERGFYKEAEN